MQPKLIFKTLNFSSFFLNWEKLRSPFRTTFKSFKISLWTGKNLELQSKTNIQKSQLWIYGLGINWESLGPNLSFTVENNKHNEWDIPLPQIVKIYQWLGEKSFPLEKVEFWAHCKLCAYHIIFGPRKGWCILPKYGRTFFQKKPSHGGQTCGWLFYICGLMIRSCQEGESEFHKCFIPVIWTL